MMTITTLSGRGFNQGTSTARKVAASGPVFIADHGRLAHALLTIEARQKITRTQPGIVEIPFTTAIAAIDCTPPCLSGDLYTPADLT